ncbi:MAG: helix-turn-helix domain-containing protein [Anaerolineae bacterium]
MARQENKVNRYIRERIRAAREEAGESQDDLAKVLYKGRVAISDLERGRVNVDASELVSIALHYYKPIAYFFPPYPNMGVRGELTVLEQQLIMEFRRLPEPQRLIALDYVTQQRRAVERALNQKPDAYLLDDLNGE